MRLLFCFFIVLQWSCSNSNNAIKIKGSDTEVNLAVNLAERFYRVNKDFTVAISGGGSGLGIASLMNGETDIANSSRPLNAEEDSLLRSRRISIHTIVFAEDATAFIVHKAVALDSIDTGTLSEILSGRCKSWKKITGQDIPINIYGRQNNSGTHSFVSRKLGIQFTPDAKEMNGNAQIVEAIKTDVSGIGYVGAGYILHNRSEQSIKVLKISESIGQIAISPLDKQAILARHYFFQRPLYQFVPETSWKKVEAFIDFERGPVGREIIQTSGYYILDTD